jgi:cAMP-dependent protein kinase regulator
MGSQNSKDDEKEGRQGPFETLATAFSGGLPKSTRSLRLQVNRLNPAVALQTLMKPGQRAAKQGAHHLKNIFAVPLDFINYKPPIFPKSEAEEAFILESLNKNFVFAGVAPKPLASLVQAFEKYETSTGDTIIKQGDQGDYFYILYAGKCNFQVDGKTVGEAGPGDSFGELALLYTCPRAATVQAMTDVTGFRVDQKSFRYLLRQQTEDSEKEKLALLAKVPFLADLHPSDLQKLADVMTPRSIPAGEKKSIRKGEQLQFFFVLQSGRIRCTNVLIGGAAYGDYVLEAGSYGGEQVILMNHEKELDAVVEEDVLAFMIDEETFKKVMGSHEGMMMRSADKKQLVRYRCRCFCSAWDYVSTCFLTLS